MARQHRPTVRISTERVDYTRVYTLEIKPYGLVTPYILRAQDVPSIIAFVKLMVGGIYAVRVETGDFEEDRKIETDLIAFTQARVLTDD